MAEATQDDVDDVERLISSKSWKRPYPWFALGDNVYYIVGRKPLPPKPVVREGRIFGFFEKEILLFVDGCHITIVPFTDVFRTREEATDAIGSFGA